MRKNSFIALAFVALLGVSQVFAQDAIDKFDAENGISFGRFDGSASRIGAKEASYGGTLGRLIDKFDAESEVLSDGVGGASEKLGRGEFANDDALTESLPDKFDVDANKPAKTKRKRTASKTQIQREITDTEEPNGAFAVPYPVPFPDWRYAPRDLARIRASQMPPELPGWGPFGNDYEFAPYEWTARRYRMGYGDVIIAVNDRRTHNYFEYRKALARTGAYAVLTLCDPQYNAIYCVGVKKNQGRFGVTLRDWYGKGVVVVGCEPWFLCRVYKPSYPVRLGY